MAIPDHIQKNFVTDVDGFVHYWPDGTGHYSAVQLREIADELNERNREHQQKLEEYFDAEERST